VIPKCFFDLQHILELLGLSHAFDGVYGSSFMGDSCKPEVAAFEKVFCMSCPSSIHVLLIICNTKEVLSMSEVVILCISIAFTMRVLVLLYTHCISFYKFNLWQVLTAIGAEASRVALFEDSYKNCCAAKTLGMTTILINSDTAEEEGVTAEHHSTVDAVLLDSELTEPALRKALPSLWSS
jgi:hypothetical protein